MNALARSLAEALETRPWDAMARPAQIPPPGRWRIWLILGGRGAGKSLGAAQFVRTRVEAGLARRVAVIGRTAADVRDVQIEGPSGLLTIAPPWFRPVYEPSKRRLTWPNGAVGTLFSADEPDLLRGPQHDLAFCDEWASFGRLEDVWTNLLFGLRMGRDPRCVISTTPRPIPLLRDLLARDGKDVAVTRMTTFDNLANLAPGFAEDIVARYANTRLGRQELYAEILEDVEGALWTRDLIDQSRLRDGETVPDLTTLVVSVDPALNTAGGSETGIIVAGTGRRQHTQPAHYYVLKDLSLRGSPLEWAGVVVRGYHDFQADKIIAEKNQGGEMVEATIHTADPSVPVKLITATRGKMTRAEPIAALYEKGLVHHVGVFKDLEEQMATFVPGEPSADRLDAAVHALTELHAGMARASSGGWDSRRLWRPSPVRNLGVYEE